MDLRYELVDGLAHAREVGRERAVDDDAAGAVLGDGHVARVAVATHEHALAGKVGAEAMLPGEVLPLRIFEPRYSAMISDCLAGTGEFGVVLIQAGREVGKPTVRVSETHSLQPGTRAWSGFGITAPSAPEPDPAGLDPAGDPS